MNWKKIAIGCSLWALAIVPPVIYSYEYGPDPGYTGAPGDNPKGCDAGGQCHISTPNTASGSITISVGGGGTTYVPGGPPQTVTVAVNDPNMNKFGFQLTARQDSNAQKDAGTLTAGSDGFTQVIDCSSSPSGGFFKGACPSSLHWIEHTLMAFDAPSNKKPGFTYTFTWTPPGTNVGTVTLYAAGNAGAGVGMPIVTPTDTYLTKLQLSPAAQGTPPAINSGGITEIFGSGGSIQPGSWISIKGNNLITGTNPAMWNADFPQSLGGTSVTINNKPAYLWYASPTQLNVEAPDDNSRGTVNVTVTTSAGSGSATVTLADASPSFQWIDANSHVLGLILRPDGSGSQGSGANSYDLLGPTGTSLGFKTVAAKAGDTVVLYGVGFGPTNPAVPAGQIFSGAAPAIDSVTLTINGKTVKPSFTGIWFTGAFQMNVTIPSGLGTGDQTMTATVNGVTSPPVLISLQ